MKASASFSKSEPEPEPEPVQYLLRTEAEIKKTEPWISFGPVHGDDDRDRDVNQNAKQSAWEHMEKSDDGVEYLRSIANVKEDVKRCYDEKVVDWVDRDPEIFMEMMAKDGCYFLQQALHILGAGDLLGYPQQHPFLGKVSNPSSYIPAMYYVGNQIPYVAINALMDQAFFKEIIAQGMEKETWKRLRKEAGEDLAKLALYQVVVEPQLKKSRKRGDEPSDVLHALRNLFLGSGDKDLTPGKIREPRDLETGSMSIRDDRFPCAANLRASGIKLKKGKPGITNIKFRNFGHSAYLYLPPFTLDSRTESLLTSLLRYEKMLHENVREVTAYVSLMTDLITTEKDFSILESSGIIRLKDPSSKEPTISWLYNQHSLDDSTFTPNFSEIRRKIREYESLPWRLISFYSITGCCIVSFIVVFTVVRTIFGVLSNNNPRI